MSGMGTVRNAKDLPAEEATFKGIFSGKSRQYVCIECMAICREMGVNKECSFYLALVKATFILLISARKPMEDAEPGG